MTDPRRSVAKRRPTAHLDGGKIEAAVGPSSEPPVRLTRRGGSGSCLAEIASNLAVVVGLHVASRELAAGVPDANRVPSKRRLLQGQREERKPQNVRLSEGKPYWVLVQSAGWADPTDAAPANRTCARQTLKARDETAGVGLATSRPV
jgi:hypothetical protein